MRGKNKMSEQARRCSKSLLFPPVKRRIRCKSSGPIGRTEMVRLRPVCEPFLPLGMGGFFAAQNANHTLRFFRECELYA